MVRAGNPGGCRTACGMDCGGTDPICSCGFIPACGKAPYAGNGAETSERLGKGWKFIEGIGPLDPACPLAGLSIRELSTPRSSADLLLCSEATFFDCFFFFFLSLEEPRMPAHAATPMARMPRAISSQPHQGMHARKPPSSVLVVVVVVVAVPVDRKNAGVVPTAGIVAAFAFTVVCETAWAASTACPGSAAACAAEAGARGQRLGPLVTPAIFVRLEPAPCR
mmetsp:Transcript_60910/g.171674  ORF Transcript_60910/g.171674 Transcript_60910/m.171674 type:complete len:223 (-) Transcript_60910:337-1005(-)